ncbi:MAG: dihydrodipicolinate synthase family protein [Phycisphaerae bacterium]
MRLEGLIAAVVTPMNPDGSLCLERVADVVSFLQSRNVKGAFVCGTTGESASLAADERRAVAEAYIDAASGSMPVIVHVGHDSLTEAAGLARHAAEAGADAIAAVPPVYFKPENIDVLADCCARIAEAAEALPFYYYHFPKLTGVAFPMRNFLPAAGAKIPNLGGVKFTHMDTMDYQRCLEADGGRYQALFGHDGYVLAALGVGAKGFVGSAHNFASPLYHKLRNAFTQGDKSGSLKWQSIAAGMVGTFTQFGTVPSVKATMSLLGIECGPCRLPLRSLDETRSAALKRALQGHGVWDVIA